MLYLLLVTSEAPGVLSQQMLTLSIDGVLNETAHVDVLSCYQLSIYIHK